MKQIIVMIAMVMLGIAIAGMVATFKDTANDISVTANNKVKQVISNE
ncbi:hypothetical protein [Anaerovorax odorimutans]|nr:hypothetical protein [Anaerovorax odorimutans]